jgi:septal ring factor EnvC (AmiA/AmiB activator)
VGGIVTYLAGVKVKREERDRWKRGWQHQQELKALERAREEREARRREFLKRLIALSSEADELRAFLSRLQTSVSASSPGELLRMIEWAEERLRRLEGELTLEEITAVLRAKGLFREPTISTGHTGRRFSLTESQSRRM